MATRYIGSHLPILLSASGFRLTASGFRLPAYVSCMTPEAIRLVRETWAQVEATRLELAQAFYGHLFRIAPDTRRLFSHIPPAVQAEKFGDMLHEIVRVIDRPWLTCYWNCRGLSCGCAASERTCGSGGGSHDGVSHFVDRRTW